MTYKTFRRICTALLIGLILCLEVKAQNIPIYGNLVPSDSGALDIGSPSLHWDTIFVDAIYPPVSGSGIWFETNDSTIGWNYGTDSLIIYDVNGDIGIVKPNGSGLEIDASSRINLQGVGVYVLKGSNVQQAQLNLREDEDNGTNNVVLQPPASLAANYTLTFPDDDGTGTQYLTGNGSGVLSWSSASAISPWTGNDTVIEWAGLYNTTSIVNSASGTLIVLDGLIINATNGNFEFSGNILPYDSNIVDLGSVNKRYQNGLINSIYTYSIIDEASTVNTTAGDAATINAISGRFRKDATGATFTVTNSYITANSIVLLTPANAAIDATATTWTVDVSGGNILVTFNAAPTANFDMNFFVIN